MGNTINEAKNACDLNKGNCIDGNCNSTLALLCSCTLSVWVFFMLFYVIFYHLHQCWPQSGRFVTLHVTNLVDLLLLMFIL